MRLTSLSLPSLSLAGCFFTSALALTYKAADFSSLAVVEGQGIHYSDAGTTKAFETILASHGCNTARIRVWTSGQYSLSYGLALAKRVKATGMTLVVDLHFSDTCAWLHPSPIYS